MTEAQIAQAVGMCVDWNRPTRVVNATAPAAGSLNPSGSGAQLVTTGVVSAMLSVPKETLSKWRQTGIGPEFIRLPNGRVRYDIAVIGDWLDTLRIS